MQIKQFRPENHHIKTLIYGTPKSGKTTFGGTAENALFLSAESGLLSIADKNPSYQEIKTIRDLEEAYQYLLKEKHEFRTVIIDSITEINDIIKAEIEKKTGRAMQLQDWGYLSKKIQDLFRKFRDLPMNVILISHEQYINDEDKIHKIVPSLNGKSATDIVRFFDIVGYAHPPVIKNGVVVETAWIETLQNPKLVTGDRSNVIGNDTPPDFTEWEKKIRSIKIGEQPVTINYNQSSTPEQPTIKDLGETRHLVALKTELQERGATDKNSALEILITQTDKKYTTLELSEPDAKNALITLLQFKPQEIAPEQQGEENKKPCTIENPTEFFEAGHLLGVLAGATSEAEVLALRDELLSAFMENKISTEVYSAALATINAKINSPEEKKVKGKPKKSSK